MPNQPQLPPFDVQELGSTYSSLWMSELLILALRLNPVTLQRKPIVVACIRDYLNSDPQLMIIDEAWKIDGLVNRHPSTTRWSGTLPAALMMLHQTTCPSHASSSRHSLFAWGRSSLPNQRGQLGGAAHHPNRFTQGCKPLRWLFRCFFFGLHVVEPHGQRPGHQTLAVGLPS